LSIENGTAPQSEVVNAAFSKQSFRYDEADRANIVLRDLRKQVYAHIDKYLPPNSRILELNAGTGIDAIHFATHGHMVHATDLSDGMIHQIHSKIVHPLSDRVTSQQVSFENLDMVTKTNFDYAFSNFGGLNCTEDLSVVTRYLPRLLNPGAHVTFVIMPPVSLWEWLLVFKGKWAQAFRRLNKKRTVAHLEGEYFYTYYHSLKTIRAAFGPAFEFISSEGLAALSPPPHRDDIPLKYPKLYRLLRKSDNAFNRAFPFNRWAVHIIVTFRFQPHDGI
jgi:ubiquinone/menaquinone biosynthesis C-methylase UbiE